MFAPADSHWDEDQLEEYSLGNISEAETADIEEHLLLCELCRERLTAMEDYIHAMRSAAEILRRSENPPAA